LLNPDPAEHAKALVAAGKINEALEFSAAVSKSLKKTLKELTKLRRDLHGGIFEAVARAGDATQARVHYDFIHMLAEAAPLADAAVEDRYFRALFAVGTRPMPISRKYRHMVLVKCLREVLDLAGDVAECGCFRGLSSWMICATLNEEGGGFDGTGHHIFDSFEGLSEPVKEDALSAEVEDAARLATMMRPGKFTCPEAQVRRHLKAFPGIAYHPGWLPQSLVGLPERNYRFVHLDVDLYAPTLGSLEYFYPRLVPGGIVLTDDYGWPGARQAFDEFCTPRHLSFETLPTNQAILRKPR
jgi:O-methyltransferase